MKDPGSRGSARDGRGHGGTPAPGSNVTPIDSCREHYPGLALGCDACTEYMRKHGPDAVRAMVLGRDFETR